MANIANINPSTIEGQMRLLTGDYSEDEPYLEDDVYLWFYQQAGNSIVDGSILALESIINYIALSPQAWSVGQASETNASVAVLTDRLASLKTKRKSAVVPIVIHSDRKSWCDFDKAFGKNNY